MRRSTRLDGEWSNAPSDYPSQDYLVLPDQSWLDGFYAGEGLIVSSWPCRWERISRRRNS